ncbi:MAG: alpha-L-fucosidase [Pirellulaceae bacterium]|jgi:alpha-L-fucosidase|nr:alpha-L-fucosidase [Pirellulaceae bacterium]
MARRIVVSCCLALTLVGLAHATDPAFVPKDLPGCVWWIKADAGVMTNDCGDVTKWLDQSGQGNDIEKVLGNAPVLATGPSNQKIVRFDGQSSLQGSHDFSKFISAHSLLLLARWTDKNPIYCQRVLFSPSWNWAFGYLDGDDQTWLAGIWVYQKDWNIYGPGSMNTYWHLHTATIEGGPRPSVEFWKDGTKLMERRLNLVPNDTPLRQIALGGKSKCEIAEILVYDRVLSDAELTRLWKYFSAKYRVSTPAVSIPGRPPEEIKEATYPIAKGPFKPDWRSFKQYECPQWFRDAKFGLWAHWGPQCQPEDGDWYGHHMYHQGSRQYQYHVEHYGHPSKFGFKDVCNLWKADKWEPEKLIQLYKRAGAKYFVAMANHHDNFDNWNSKYQPWNSVNVGPKKDIIGTWANLARENGLRFGVTVHTARALGWFQAYDSDKTGPLAGVPYDGVMTKADGKGKWWEGLDPADLYGPKEITPEAKQAFADKFFSRVKDLVDSYHPDLLYFDDTVPPLGAAGMNIVAHFLNANMQWHQGKMEAVYNTKIYDAQPPKDVYKCLVDDFEGGRAHSIQPYPWQTDTCIGNWHYYRGIEYRTAENVIKELVDIVSKNGNLLLNIPVRGDGSIDEDELKFLAGLTKWMDVNSEGIYGTRPWRVFGEGETDSAGEFVNNGRDRPYTGSDIRFGSKGSVLYATLMAWPGQRAVVKSLGRSVSAAKVAEVSLLGHNTPLKWEQTETGLEVAMPVNQPCEHAFVLKIAGENLTTTE